MTGSPSERYLFTSYVVGASNESAYAAASAAAVSPGQLYNPILIVGGTGLGKTHLAHALVAEALLRPDRRALLERADDLYRRIVDRVAKAAPEPAETHDIIVIDDVHVLEGRALAEELLAELIAGATGRGAQVVLTSDTMRNTDAFAQRIVQRHRTAHIAALGMPDWSHRLAILESKVRLGGRDVPAAVLHHLAGFDGDTVRALEGRLIRLLAVSELTRVPLTLQLAQQLDPHPDPAPAQLGVKPAIHAVQQAVAAEWGVPISALIGPSRVRTVNEPRRHCMLLCRDLLSLSLREIGAAFGRRDASTVKSALARAHEELTSHPGIGERARRVRAHLALSG